MSSETSLPWLVQNKPSAQIRRRCRTTLNSLKDNFMAKSFRCRQKGNWEHSFELSLSISVFYQRIFNLEMQTFSLENHNMMKARQPLCWWMTATKVSNPFLPSPPKWLTWPLDVCGGVGYGSFYWFSWDFFSQTSLELEIFSPRYKRYKIFFSALYVMSDISFSAGCFSPEFICMLFSSRNQPAGHFFSEITHNPLKSQMVGP